MEIELFTNTEVSELADESERLAHLALSASLNLDIQTAHSSAKSPMPFSEVDTYTGAVYRTIFDVAESLATYSGVVPTRVLMTIQMGIDNEWWTTDDLFVRSSSTYPDPVLYRKPSEASTFTNRMILIARWADALVPFEKLAEEARRRIVVQSGSALREKIAVLEKRLAFLDAEAASALLGGATSINTY